MDAHDVLIRLEFIFCLVFEVVEFADAANLLLLVVEEGDATQLVAVIDDDRANFILMLHQLSIRRAWTQISAHVRIQHLDHISIDRLVTEILR